MSLESRSSGHLLAKASIQALSTLDVVQCILEKTLLPHFLVDPALCAVPSSMWLQLLRQKVAHTTVSKTWYYAGVPLLYEDICIQQIDQLPLLSRSLTRNQNLLPYLKRLHFYSFVPECYSAQALDHLIQVLGSCPNLYSFSVIAPPELPSLSILPPIPPSITHLSLNQQVAHMSAVTVLQSTSPTLHSLSLCRGFGDVPNLSFPQLTSLTLICADDVVDGVPWTVLITNRWSFPFLQSLTLQQNVFSSANILALCRQYGPTLTYLSLHPVQSFVAPGHWGLDTEAPDDDPRFLDIYPCLHFLPTLQHLVLYSSITLPSLEGPIEFVPHPNIEWIDIWCGTEWAAGFIGEQAVIGLIRRCADPGRFPALKGIRTISLGLAGFTSLPKDIPPLPELALTSGPWESRGTLYEVPDLMMSQSFMFEYLPGFRVCHVPGRVHEVDCEWLSAKNKKDSTYDSHHRPDLYSTYILRLYGQCGEEWRDDGDSDSETSEIIDLDTEFGYALMETLPDSFSH